MIKKSKIKKGDTVLVISGKEKGKTGKVVSVDLRGNKVIVDGLNIYKKSAKPSNKYPQGGIIDLAKPIPVSNLMIICPGCNKASRIKTKREKGSISRICSKCGEVLNVA